jgi:PAS domain S-box-containing protein
MIGVVDRDYRYVIANQAFLRNRRMTGEQVVGRRVPEIIDPAVFESIVKPKLDACLAGSVVHYEMKYVYPKLGERQLSISYFPIEGPAGVDRVACVLEDVTEERRAESELRASEDRYRDFVEHSEDLVCTHDLQGNLLSVNPTAPRLLGYSVDELLKIRMQDLIIPEGREEFERYLERLRTTSQPEQGLLCVMTKSGEVRTWEYHNTLRTQGVDKPIVRGMAHDITEQRRAELALLESEERLRLAQDVARIGTFDRNLLTGENRWSPQMELIYGLKPGTFPRTIEQFIQVVHPEDREHVSELVKKSMECGEAQGEWRVQWPDGSVHWIAGRWHVFKDNNGTPVRAIGMDYDITERKRAEDEQKKTELALRKSEAHFRILVEQASDGIFIADSQGKYLDVNSAGAEMLGYTREEILERSISDVIAPEETARVAPETGRLAGDAIRTEWKFRCKDGSFFPGEVSGKRLPDGRLQGILRDVTERKRAEDRLREFERVVEGLEEMIVVVDRDYRYIIANSAYLKHRGKTKDDVIGRLVTDFVEPEVFEPQLRRNLEKAFRGEIVQFDLTYAYPALGERSLTINYYPIEGPEGIDRVACVLQDVTEIMEAQNALRHSEERFRIALKHSLVTVFQQDADLRYTWIYNPQLFLNQEVIGKTDDQILGAVKAARMNELKKRVLETGKPVREETAVPHNDTLLAFDMTIEPVLDAENKIVGITGAAMNIARLRELVDGLTDAKEKLAQEKSYLESEIQAELGFEEIVGQSPALRNVLKDARIVAPLDSTVLLLGESGTGKELVARGLHALSSRKDRTFIKLNCAAVPSGLLESELFGHEKGAFTGAVSQKVGRIELADKGTLFLDEIGEMPQDLQPKLLRVLQDREFERLGGVRTLKVDVRIIAATNRELQKDVAAKTFREDLFYRLNVFPILLPTLRERRSDIPLLVRHFVHKHATRMGKKTVTIPDDTMLVLQNWNWPGNVRELENMIERMVILTKGNVLAPPPDELSATQDAVEDDLMGMEREHIIRVLRDTDGVLAGADGAASRLGMKRTTLQSMLKRLGIDAQEFRRGSGTNG